MRIAIPTLNEEFSPHFGKCDALFICDIDPQTRKIGKTRHIPRPTHHEKTLMHMVIEMSVEMVLAGGMNHNTYQNLESCGIDCCLGMTGKMPIEILLQYINEPDMARENICPSNHDSSDPCEEAC
jgi:predicted Fe-Mo cluster-binding NifX family protein